MRHWNLISIERYEDENLILSSTQPKIYRDIENKIEGKKC